MPQTPFLTAPQSGFVKTLIETSLHHMVVSSKGQEHNTVGASALGHSVVTECEGLCVQTSKQC